MYFVLAPESELHTTILLPVDNAGRFGLRRIISPEEADQILDFLADQEEDWESDAKQRKLAYETSLRSPDLFVLAKMIRELLAQQTRAVLGNFEKELLPKAQKRLFSEIALAKGQPFDEILHAVCQEIRAQ